MLCGSKGTIATHWFAVVWLVTSSDGAGGTQSGSRVKETALPMGKQAGTADILHNQLIDTLFSEKETIASEQHRGLIWSDSERLCNDALFNSVRQGNPDVDFCLEGEIQWDADGILTSSFVGTGGPNTLYTSVYLARYKSVGTCAYFDICISLETFNVLGGQYAYDCSNVYCGPNARRDCNGNYDETRCPEGVDASALVDIPALRDVNCQAYRNFIDSTTHLGAACGSCQAADGDATVMLCDSYCVGCSAENGICLTNIPGYRFTEVGDIVQDCFSDNTNGNSWCLTQLGPPGLGQPGSLEQHRATIELNGIPCEISICGFRNGPNFLALYALGEVLYKGDCSAVVQDSTFDDCEEQYSGAFRGLRSLDVSASCTADTVSFTLPNSVPSFPLITGSPIATIDFSTAMPITQIFSPISSPLVPAPLPTTRAPVLLVLPAEDASVTTAQSMAAIEVHLTSGHGNALVWLSQFAMLLSLAFLVF